MKELLANANDHVHNIMITRFNTSTGTHADINARRYHNRMKSIFSMLIFYFSISRPEVKRDLQFFVQASSETIPIPNSRSTISTFNRGGHARQRKHYTNVAHSRSNHAGYYCQSQKYTDCHHDEKCKINTSKWNTKIHDYDHKEQPSKHQGGCDVHNNSKQHKDYLDQNDDQLINHFHRDYQDRDAIEATDKTGTLITSTSLHRNDRYNRYRDTLLQLQTKRHHDQDANFKSCTAHTINTCNDTSSNNNNYNENSHHHRNDRHDHNSNRPTNNGNFNSNTSQLLQIPCSLILQQHSQNNHQNASTTSTNTSSLLSKSTPISIYLDTGAQVTIMTYAAAKRAGVAHLIDTRYQGHACGVAGVSCKVLGRIPAQSVSFLFSACCNSNNNHNHHHTDTDTDTSTSSSRRKIVCIDKSPAITILEGGMEHHGVDMLLGLDILEEWQASICFKHKTLTLRSSHPDSSSKRQPQQNYIIPFGVEHSNIQPNQQHRLYDQLTNNNDDYTKRHHHYSMNHIPTTNDQSAELLSSQHQDIEQKNHDPYDDNDYDYDNDYRNLNRKERNPRNRILKRPSTSFATAKNVKEIFSSPKNNLPSTNILPRNTNDNKYNMHQKSFPDKYNKNLSASYNDNGEDSVVTAKSAVECHHELSTRNKQQDGMDTTLSTTTSSTSLLKDDMDSITDNDKSEFYDDDDDDDDNDEYVLSSDDDYDGFDLSGI